MSSLARTTCDAMSDSGLGPPSPENEQSHQAESAEPDVPDIPETEQAPEQAAADDAAGRAHAQEDETDEQKKARLDAALRKYRATLRNEAETGNGGFSADYYRSQKPPHW